MKVMNWLDERCASDVMMYDVVTLMPQDLLAHAAWVFLREEISGAPVVDDAGVCVGILSASDLPRAEEQAEAEKKQLARSELFHSSLSLPTSVYEERLSSVRDKLIPAAEQPIERFMSRDIVGVDEGTPLRSVVQQMVDSHVHRVVVLDGEGRLRGIISTMDILSESLKL